MRLGLLRRYWARLDACGRFDAGVHVRLGDACDRDYALLAADWRCDMNLSVARRPQDAGVRNGTYSSRRIPSE